MNAIAKESAVGKVFNIATGEHATLNDLLKTLCDISGRDFCPDYKDVVKVISKILTQM